MWCPAHTSLSFSCPFSISASFSPKGRPSTGRSPCWHKPSRFDRRVLSGSHHTEKQDKYLSPAADPHLGSIRLFLCANQIASGSCNYCLISCYSEQRETRPAASSLFLALSSMRCLYLLGLTAAWQALQRAGWRHRFTQQSSYHPNSHQIPVCIGGRQV